MSVDLDFPIDWAWEGPLEGPSVAFSKGISDDMPVVNVFVNRKVGHLMDEN